LSFSFSLSFPFLSFPGGGGGGGWWWMVVVAVGDGDDAMVVMT
jgi:hypothetical protein